MPGMPHRWVYFAGAGVLTVTVTAPTSGSTVISASPTITWTLTGGSGTQSAYRVSIYSDPGATVPVYDSSYVASAVLSATVPVGVLLTGVTLYLRVQAIDSNGAQGESGLIDFMTAFATAGNVANVQSGITGTNCISPDSLPAVRLSWDQVVPGAGETFAEYQVWRSEDAGATWTVLTRITSITTLAYTDFTPASWVAYTYAVVYVANAGASVLISQPGAKVAFLDFDFAWLAAVDDPTQNVRLDGWQFAETTNDAVSFDELWGRGAPRPRVGDRNYRAVNMTLAERLLGDQQLARVRALADAQRQRGTLLLFRHGRARERMFCALSAARYGVAQKTGAVTLALTESDYTEGV